MNTAGPLDWLRIGLSHTLVCNSAGPSHSIVWHRRQHLLYGAEHQQKGTTCPLADILGCCCQHIGTHH